MEATNNRPATVNGKLMDRLLTDAYAQKGKRRVNLFFSTHVDIWRTIHYSTGESGKIERVTTLVIPFCMISTIREYEPLRPKDVTDKYFDDKRQRLKFNCILACLIVIACLFIYFFS